MERVDGKTALVTVRFARNRAGHRNRTRPRGRQGRDQLFEQRQGKGSG